MRYKFDFNSPAKQIKFNHCSIMLTERLYSKEDIPIFTIEKYTLDEINPKLITKFKQPKLVFPKVKPNLEFKPDISVCVAMANHKVMKLNKLVFVSIRKNGKLIEKRIEREGTQRGRPMKSYMTNAFIIIDKANKRVRLSGPKTSPEWLKVEKI